MAAGRRPGTLTYKEIRQLIDSGKKVRVFEMYTNRGTEISGPVPAAINDKAIREGIRVAHISLQSLVEMNLDPESQVSVLLISGPKGVTGIQWMKVKNLTFYAVVV